MPASGSPPGCRLHIRAELQSNMSKLNRPRSSRHVRPGEQMHPTTIATLSVNAPRHENVWAHIVVSARDKVEVPKDDEHIECSPGIDFEHQFLVFQDYYHRATKKVLVNFLGLMLGYALRGRSQSGCRIWPSCMGQFLEHDINGEFSSATTPALGHFQPPSAS